MWVHKSSFTSNIVGKVEVPLLPHMAAHRPGKNREVGNSAGTAGHWPGWEFITPRGMHWLRGSIRDVVMSWIRKKSRVGSLWPTVVYIRINDVYIVFAMFRLVSLISHYSLVTSLSFKWQFWGHSRKCYLPFHTDNNNNNYHGDDNQHQYTNYW